MDINALAKSIVDQASGEKPINKPNSRAPIRGTARANALRPERREEIALKAATVRWAKKLSKMRLALTVWVHR